MTIAYRKSDGCRQAPFSFSITWNFGVDPELSVPRQPPRSSGRNCPEPALRMVLRFDITAIDIKSGC
jgi:hypothetical protein